MMDINRIASMMFEEIEPMSEDMSRIFVMLSLTERKSKEVLGDLSESFPFQVIKKRLQWAYGDDVQVATPAVIATCSLQCDRVGTAVLYAAVIAAIYHYQQRTVTLQDLVAPGRFAWGFTTPAQLEKVWRAQKKGGANWIDDPDAWPSKQKEAVND